jgi:hypothetical protein
MNKGDIDKYPWHDAVLRNVLVDRSNPGHNDVVELLIEWNDGRISRFIFHDCYAMRSAMNFGVVAEETIRSVDIVEDGDEVDSLKAKWSGAGSTVSKIKCFRLETNSTASVISIFALGIEVVNP